MKTLLFLPGNDIKKIEKAIALQPDVIIMDLEDGVAFSEKGVARNVVAEALQNLDFGPSKVSVRINPIHTSLWKEDIQVANAAQFVTIAKVESATQLWQLREKTDLPFLPIVESARGILRVDEIAFADHQLLGLVFGGEDYAASVGAIRSSEGLELLYARSAIVCAAAAVQIPAIDTVYVDFKDDEGLERESLYAKQLGFSGKLAIHPQQVPIIHRVFAPTAEQIAAAKALLAAYKAHEEKGMGVFNYQDKMVDMPLVLQAERMLKDL